MFGKLGRLVVHNPWKVIAVWLLAAIAIVGFAPGLDDVVTHEQTNFLPSKYESVQAQDLAKDAFSTNSTDATATIVVKRSDGSELSSDDQTTVGTVAQRVQGAHIDKVVKAETGPQALSPNKKVQLINVTFDGLPDDKLVTAAVDKVRDASKSALRGTPLVYAVTGDAALVLDNQDAFDSALKIIGFATVVLIIGLLLLIYRSPIAAIMPIVTIAVVSLISPGLIALVAKASDLQVDQSLQVILTIVLYGVGTDYIVFLLFRYREQLRAGEDRKQALVTAVARVGEVIASAAGAIVVAFLVLLLAVFGGFKSLGPGLAIAVAVMALAAVTLIPAVVSLLGTKVFWPSKSWQKPRRGTVFQRLGGFTGRRPAVVAVIAGGLMLVLAAGALKLSYDYDQFGQLPDRTESAQGLKDLQVGFPAGALNPTSVYVEATDGQRLDDSAIEGYARTLKNVPGVGGVMPAGPDGEMAKFSEDHTVAQIDLLLPDSAYANKSLDTAGGPVRDVAHAKAPQGTKALVGGVSAAFADIRDANSRDLGVIFPVAGLLILVILALLLRSLVAPVYLMLAVVVGFFSTLGATVIAFQGIGGRAGLTFSLPIVLYLFVVAIGTDYNILMIARLREEAREGNGPRRSAALAIEHGGPSVGAAGMILAGTFASMVLSGIAFLTQIGFSVSVGILIAAFIMSMFLVPSITALLGRAAWWPRHHGTPAGEVAEHPEPATVGTGQHAG